MNKNLFYIILQIRKTMNNRSYYCISTKTKLIPDIIHGRVREYEYIYFFLCTNDSFKYVFSEQPSIRDLIENKYLHEWLHKSALRRCKEIFNNNTSVSKK